MFITGKELEHRITETFPKLAKKYHISDDVTKSLIYELSYVLKTPSRQNYETVLFYVQQAWDELKKQLDSWIADIDQIAEEHGYPHIKLVYWRM